MDVVRIFLSRGHKKAAALGLIVLLTIMGVAPAQTAKSPVTQSASAGTDSVIRPTDSAGNGQAANSPSTPSELPIDNTNGNGQPEVQLRPFDLTLPRDHLLGDWGGLLPKMEDAGVTPTLNYLSNIAGNPTGGKYSALAYADNIGLGLLFDLHKIVGLDGGSFLISMSQRDGTSLTQRSVGNVFSVQQVYGGQTFHLIDVAYGQKLFNDCLDISVGRIAAGDDFLVSPYNYLFMQNGFDGNPVGIFFNSPGMTAYPNATWGARFKVTPTKRSYVMVGVYNGDATIRTDESHGANMSMNGPLQIMAETGYRYNGLPGDSQYLGNYKLGGWLDRNTYTNYNTVGYAAPASTTQGNWGIYGMFDQVVLPFGERGSNRGMGVFGSALFSPDQSVSQMPYFFTAGLAARGIWAERPVDTAGFGVVFGEFSNDLRAAEQREQLLTPTIGIQSHETVLEWTYRINMDNGAIFVQPDIQYVLRPGGTGQIANALVLGAQIGVNF
jgi:porin